MTEECSSPQLKMSAEYFTMTAEKKCTMHLTQLHCTCTKCRDDDCNDEHIFIAESSCGINRAMPNTSQESLNELGTSSPFPFTIAKRDTSTPRPVSCSCLQNTTSCESCTTCCFHQRTVAQDNKTMLQKFEDSILTKESQKRSCAICTLKTDIEDLKQKLRTCRYKNEKLQNQLLHHRQEKCMKNRFVNFTKSHLYQPGLITDLVAEIYDAQRERDEVAMARIHLANDERDEALQQLHDVRYKYHELLSGNSDNDHLDLENVMDIKPFLNNSENILRVKSALMSKLATTNHFLKSSIYSMADSRLSAGTDSFNCTDDESKHYKEHYSVQKCLPSNEITLLKRRLLEEMEARQKAENNCQNASAYAWRHFGRRNTEQTRQDWKFPRRHSNRLAANLISRCQPYPFNQ